jgi:hypothetical protein
MGNHKGGKPLGKLPREMQVIRREKMTVFWDVAPCDRPDDGGSKHFWNVGKLLPDYMAQHSRRQSSSYSLPWEPEISSRRWEDNIKICLKEVGLKMGAGWNWLTITGFDSWASSFCYQSTGFVRKDSDSAAMLFYYWPFSIDFKLDYVNLRLKMAKLWPKRVEYDSTIN